MWKPGRAIFRREPSPVGFGLSNPGWWCISRTSIEVGHIIQDCDEDMFTGLIQKVGKVASIRRMGRSAELAVETGLETLTLGESVAVNGACLSVTRFQQGRMSAFASEETLERTGLGAVSPGIRVNLERALRVGDPIGGHIVTGHVDARVHLLSRQRVGEAERFALALPKGTLAKQIASKGSVTLDGVSLTVNEVTEGSFHVMIIPLTLNETTLGESRPGDEINIETDVMAKYIARQLSADGAKRDIDMAMLARAGFLNEG